MRYNKATLQIFIIAQGSIIGLILLILMLSFARLNDVRSVLSTVTSNAVPALTQATALTREVQHLISLTARLTSSENQSARRIVKTQVDETLSRLQSPSLINQDSERYLSTQLNVLAQEIDELNGLVRRRISVEQEAHAEREALFLFLNRLVDKSSADYLSEESADVLVSLILQIAQINQQFQLHELRLLETQIENAIEALAELSSGARHNELVSSLSSSVLGDEGMVDKQANILRIRGRSRGRGSFVEHLAEEVATNIEFKAANITQETSAKGQKAIAGVSKQITQSLVLSGVVMLICCIIIVYIYKRIILRLIDLTKLVEKGSTEVENFQGSDEIARLAKSFASYFERVRSQEDELIRLSLSDALTKIPNRRAFELEIEKSMALAKRHSWPLTLMLLDVDSFKGYNDHYGHTQGDECLKAVAAGLNSAITRTTDFCARYGGEEFVVILPCTDESGARIKAEDIRASIESLQLEHKKSAISDYVTMSLGVATFNYSGTKEWSLNTMLNEADAALYEAKASGRNCCKFASHI